MCVILLGLLAGFILNLSRYFQIYLKFMTPEETNRELNLLRQELENTKQAKNHEIIELKHALNRAEIHIVPIPSCKENIGRQMRLRFN